MKAIKRDMRIFFPDTLELEKACSYVNNLVLVFVEVPRSGMGIGRAGQGEAS